MTIRIAIAFLSVLLAAGSVRAEDCPEDVPEDSAQRRAIAKKWFSIGEDAQKENDNVVALKAYQCSIKFVPHGFTAYNIAMIAERIGDLELAIASYNQYLLLAPDAKDTQEVNEKVEALKVRLAMARENAKARARLANATRTGSAITPPPHHRGTAGATSTGSTGTGSGLITTIEDRDTTGDTSRRNYRTAAWITYGSGGVLLATGVLTNILARNKMDTCRSKYKANDQPAAETACSDARPLAYLSYVTLGLGAAAVVAGTVLILLPTDSSSDSSNVSMNVLPEGGLALSWGGKF
jgi:tetratricopeptide (TPR) repeat protein